MRRRNVIQGIAACTAWPLAARAQQPAMPVIGYLHSGSPDAFERFVVTFRKGLNEAGYVEGQNVAIEYRWADGHFDRLPALATDLVRRGVAVLVAQGGATATIAAKAATATIPIVFTTGGDPVTLGLIASLSHPGGNATGVYILSAALGSKRLEIVHQVVPAASVVAVLINPNNATAPAQLKDLEEAGRTLGVQPKIFNTGNAAEIDAAFAAIVQARIGALIFGSDPVFFDARRQLVDLATQYKIPAVYELRDHAEIGGLMSYGTSLAEAYRQVGLYTGRILKGEKPADLPVVQSTKVELVINLKTAKALGIEFPLSLLGRADEVIE